MSDYTDNLHQILEAAIFAADEPLSIQKLLNLFTRPFVPTVEDLKAALAAMAESCQTRGVELVEVASGYRFQAKAEYAPWLQKMWEKKPARYTRAVLETLALIAYRQPITRGEVEEVRGVAVNPEIIKKLMDREWIKIVGHRDVPGKPALFGTTKKFLDYFNLKRLTDLPPLEEIKDLEQIGESLGMQLTLGVDPSLGQAEAIMESEEGSADVQDESVAALDKNQEASDAVPEDVDAKVAARDLGAVQAHPLKTEKVAEAREVLEEEDCLV